jgi:hypothetical protein
VARLAREPPPHGGRAERLGLRERMHVCPAEDCGMPLLLEEAPEGEVEAVALTLGEGEAVREKWGEREPKNGPEYNAMLREAKFVPCFRGSKALESYRVYEALEHGAIPFYVPSDSPNLSVTQDGYTEVLGKHPILAFPSWEKAAELLPLLAQNPAQMEEHRTALKTWWANKKVDLQKQVNDALTKA